MGLVIAMTACRPGPGETKCRTTMVFGVAHTKCEQGPPIESEEAPVSTVVFIPAPKPKPAPVAIEDPPLEHVHQDGDGWRCATKGGAQLEEPCFTDDDSCRQQETMWRQNQSNVVVGCHAQAVAACVTVLNKLSGTLTNACFASIATCRSWRRDMVQYDREDFAVAAACIAIERSL